MALDLIAPAKINLTLEVLGRRSDGYHDIASIMQTIDLADRVRIERSGSLEVQLEGDVVAGLPVDADRNLAYVAARALAEAVGRPQLGVRIVLEKHVPAAMGLGGGSSDAAAVLRGLNRLWELGLDTEALTRVACRVGADVPFFLHGGTALVGGRGESVEELPDVPPFALTLFVADVRIEDKTRHMYSLLGPSDFSDGRKTQAAVEKVRRSLIMSGAELFNAFDPHVERAAPQMGKAMTACRAAGLDVIACGSGPAFLALASREQLSQPLVDELAREWKVRAVASRTLSRNDALAIHES
jgi:4-diphosphocytidyl-2-C-methyl-D-erythritol kinase